MELDILWDLVILLLF